MINIINKNYIAAFVIGLVVFAFASIALAASPTIETMGATKITERSAYLNLYFTSQDTRIDGYSNDRPIVTIEYGETRDLGEFTEGRTQYTSGSRQSSFYVDNLEEDERYYYRAVMYYDDNIVRGSILSFRTKESGDSDSDSLNVIDVGTGASGGGSSSSGSGSGVVYTSSGSGSGVVYTSSGSGSGSGSGSSITDPTGGNSTDYLFISIENGDQEVNHNEVTTYTVEYRNFSDVELENATLVISIPEEMRVISTKGERLEEADGNLTAFLGDLKPGEEDTIKVTGRVQKRSEDEYIVAHADIVYEVGNDQETATDSDIDEYNGPQGSVLGAAAFGAGFFPTTIFGWMLLLAILFAIIVVVRRFYLRPVYATERRFPEENNPAAVNQGYSR